jgi:predicted enzyme related to lactoylglutathione lyase
MIMGAVAQDLPSAPIVFCVFVTPEPVMTIMGVHAILYSKKAEATRAFLRDVLGWRSVDAGEGWLIFAAPPTEIAVHPSEGREEHELYLMCDDIAATVAELEKKGIRTAKIQEQPWGRLTQITLPGGQELGMYQPKHPLAIARAR